MKILVLTSRYTATRDIVGEDFGRQTRLFEALAKYGHSITFFCADYRKKENRNTKLHGIDVRIRPFGIFHFFSFKKELKNTLKKERWDLMIATSDPLWGVIGNNLAKKCGVKFLYDLHDNYETYGMYKMPFFGILDRRAVKKADIVTTVSNELKKMLKERKIRDKNVYVIQNGAETKIFKPMDKKKSREKIGILQDKKIIAYAGSLQRRQGIDVLIDAFRIVKEKEKSAMLVIAGNFFGNEKKFLNLSQEGIKYMGSITQKNVALLINSADVAIVPNRDDNFTRYCFPYKIAEYTACKRPVVVTNVGDAAEMVGKRKDSLCIPGNAKDMAEKILVQLKKNGKSVLYDTAKNTWKHVAGILDRVIREKV